jgi:hypothetical protein
MNIVILSVDCTAILFQKNWLVVYNPKGKKYGSSMVRTERKHEFEEAMLTAVAEK